MLQNSTKKCNYKRSGPSICICVFPFLFFLHGQRKIFSFIYSFLLWPEKNSIWFIIKRNTINTIIYSFLLWPKRNSVWFIIKRNTFNTIIYSFLFWPKKNSVWFIIKRNIFVARDIYFRFSTIFSMSREIYFRFLSKIKLIMIGLTIFILCHIIKLNHILL